MDGRATDGKPPEKYSRRCNQPNLQQEKPLRPYWSRVDICETLTTLLTKAHLMVTRQQSRQISEASWNANKLDAFVDSIFNLGSAYQSLKPEGSKGQLSELFCLHNMSQLELGSF